MKGIIEYKRDNLGAIPKSEMYVITNQGQKKTRKTTVASKLLFKLADNYKYLVAQNDIKEAHPFSIS